MASVGDWIAEGSPEEIEVGVCFDRSLLGEFEKTLRSYEALLGERKRRNRFGDAEGPMDERDPSEEVAERLQELNEAIKADEAEHTFRFRKMPYAEFRAIIEDCPATEAQRQASPWVDHNADEAAPRLVAGSCVHPKMTLEEAEDLREFLPEAPWGDLYAAAIRVNRTGVAIPKGVSSSVDRLMSAPRSNTQPPTGSLFPDSGDE